MMMNDKDSMKLGEAANNLLGRATIGEDLLKVIGDLGYQITKKPEAWNGEGLPPVGTECEFKGIARDNQIDWSIGVVKYVSDCTVVMRLLEQRAATKEFITHPISIKFRPIRTEEEKLTEQAYNAMSDEPLQGNEMDDKDLLSYAESLVAAGWRPNN